MAAREEINNLLTNLKSAVGPDYLHRQLDLAPYKSARSWPGRPYLLIGNSYNTEVVRGQAKKRVRAIASLLEGAGAKHCVKLSAALADDKFVAVLSRFEYDWLKREQHTTLVGPAYDEMGNVVPQSFAVWRRLPTEVNQTQATSPRPRRLAGISR